MIMGSRIDSLINQLEALGYVPYQIQSILREANNDVKLDNITPAQEDQIAEYLEDYIVFAKKCKKNNR